MEKNSSVFKLVVMVAALFALLFVAIQLSRHPINGGRKMGVDKLKTGTKIVKVSADKLPNKFPVDIPVEGDVRVIQNFNATELDGRYNATREFESKKTLAQNLSIYTKYLKDNNWDIKATIDEPDMKMVMGKKGLQQLQITAAIDPITNLNIITLNLTEF